MDFEGTAGLRRRSDEQYYMDIDSIAEHLVSGGGLPNSAKRMNRGFLAHADYGDTDFMAFFERTDNGNNGSSTNPAVEAGREGECPEAERLSGIIKSLEEEISVKKSKDGDHHALADNVGVLLQRGPGDNAYSSEADHSAPHLECLGIADRPYNYADHAYYKVNIGEEHGFNVMDSVEEMNMGLNHQYPFMDEDSMPIYSGAVEVDNYYNYIPGSIAAAEGYGDGGEFFDESLWENTGS